MIASRQYRHKMSFHELGNMTVANGNTTAVHTDQPKETDPLLGGISNSSSSHTFRNLNMKTRTTPTPSEETFAQKLKQISAEKPPTKKPMDFLTAVLSLFCCPATVTLKICMVLAFICPLVPIGGIVIGAIYFDKKNCPQEPIALLLIVGGSIGAITGLLQSFMVGRTLIGKEQKSKKGFQLGVTFDLTWC